MEGNSAMSTAPESASDSNVESGLDQRTVGQLHMRRGWVLFLRDIEPERPRLFRYCRNLCRNVWDAEDLVQDTMLKAFGSIALLDNGPIHWGPYMARIASNLWIDQKRKLTPIQLDTIAEPSNAPRNDSTTEIGDGGRTLMTRLSPQERCAVVMKEVFEFSLAETADLLETTEGAIKSALHRGREKLADPGPSDRPSPSPALVQRFVDAFNAGDVEAIKSTMLETVTVEIFALGTALGLESISREEGWIQVCLNGHTPDPTRHQRVEQVLFQGEPIVLVWRRYGSGDEKVEEFWRFREEEGGFAHIWDYCACPETLSEITEALGVPVATRPYVSYYGDEMEA
jgi:RNA polymerase sigma-70 factor (ECF subfamily)